LKATFQQWTMDNGYSTWAEATGLSIHILNGYKLLTRLDLC